MSSANSEPPGSLNSVTLSNASTIASYNLAPSHSPNQLSQTAQRIRLLTSWNTSQTIKPGSNVIEIGCGQGDMTTVLASAVGPNGRVIALDACPNPETYGTPYLKEAQDHISNSEIGNRITFINGVDPVEYLYGITRTGRGVDFDCVVMANCLWYFASVKEVEDTFRAIRGLGSKIRLLISEYGLKSSLPGPEAMPHIHAALAQAALEAFKVEGSSNSNIRTVLSPDAISELAKNAGWELAREEFVIPDVGYSDGKWEVDVVLSEEFLVKCKDPNMIKDERQRAVMRAMRDTVVSNVKEGVKTRSMDVWVAEFR